MSMCPDCWLWASVVMVSVHLHAALVGQMGDMSWVSQHCCWSLSTPPGTCGCGTAVPARRASPAPAPCLGDTPTSSFYPEPASPPSFPAADGSLLPCSGAPSSLLGLFLSCCNAWTVLLSPPLCPMPPKEWEHPRMKGEPTRKEGRACEPSPEQSSLVGPGKDGWEWATCTDRGDTGDNGAGRWTFSGAGPQSTGPWEAGCRWLSPGVLKGTLPAGCP